MHRMHNIFRLIKILQNNLFGQAPVLVNSPVALLFFAALVLLSTSAQAQVSDFEQWKRQQQQAFQQYRTAEDEAFLEFLKSEWQAFQVFKGERRDTTPKPARAPAIRNSSQTTPAVLQADQEKKILTVGDAPIVSDFYGHPVPALRYPIKPTDLPNEINQANQAAMTAWQIFSIEDHSELLKAVKAEQLRLELGDWGLLLLLERTLREQGYPPNARRFYTWFILNRLQYRIKLGAANGSIFYLIPAQQTIYANRFSTIDGVRYYTVPQINDGQIFSYGDSPLTNDRLFNVDLSRLIAASPAIAEQRLNLQVDGNDFLLRWQYRPGLVQFMEDYPQVDLPLYFQTSIDSDATQSFLIALRPQLAGLGPREAVNRLLRLTQDMFVYKTDEEQFGREKYLLASESLHYAINDCEDRSIFLAWLIRKLLDLPVIALDYPGHVALAVAVPLQPGDDFIEFDNRRFVIADPTYIGAHLGETMPEMADLQPVGIPILY